MKKRWPSGQMWWKSDVFGQKLAHDHIKQVIGQDLAAFTHKKIMKNQNDFKFTVIYFSLFPEFLNSFEPIIFFVEHIILNTFYFWNMCWKCVLTCQEIEEIDGKCPDIFIDP